MASLILTYLLWLTGGWFGLHHYYLGRDKQAFLWWSTFGGFFGVGWLRDFFAIPEYVADAEIDGAIDPPTPYPPLNWTRWIAQLVVGGLYGFLVRASIPEEFVEADVRLQILVYLLFPFGVVAGIHLVGSIGDRQTGSAKHSLLAAYCVVPFAFNDPNAMNYAVLSANVAYNYGRKWRLGPRRRRSHCRRLGVLFAFGSLYLALWSTVLLFNVSVAGLDGERLRLSDVLVNFFRSEAWRDFKAKAAELLGVWMEEGWENAWRRFKKDFDISGTQRACEVLSVDCDSASQEEIRSACRRLSRAWHPDRHRDKEEKAKAQEKFIEIQDACHKLDERIQRRERAQRKDVFDGDMF